MTKEYQITSETALLAKEKGFPQDNYYLTKEQIEFLGAKVVTQARMHQWLMEDHKIFVAVGLSEDGWMVQNFDLELQSTEENMKFDMYYSYDNYKDAMEKGLFEGLKNVKNKE